MNVYDPDTVLRAIDRNAVAVVAIGGASILAMFVFFIEAIRSSRRDHVYSMALWMTALWFPHDWSYLFRFHDWFGGRYSHWFMQLFWVAIIVTAVSETTYAVQTIRYGRAQLSPQHSQHGHAMRILAVLAAGVISWSLLKGALDDHLYLLSFMATLMWGGPSGHAMLSRYPDGRGQVQSTWIAFSAMAVLYSITSICFFGGGFFHSWQYVGICVASCAWSFVLIADLRRIGVPLTASHSGGRPALRCVPRG